MSHQKLCTEDNAFIDKINALTDSFCKDNNLCTKQAWLHIQSAMVIGALARQEHVLAEFMRRKKRKR